MFCVCSVCHSFQFQSVLVAISTLLDGAAAGGGGETLLEDALAALTHWEPTTPCIALHLLLPAFRNNTRVVEFAVRSLRRCSVRAVIFLIPQLVQALRYDRTGLVEAFLREASAASELVAHQLIWNTRTYTLADDDGNIDVELARVATRLCDAVVAQFDKVQMHTYRLVFDFFANFTDAR